MKSTIKYLAVSIFMCCSIYAQKGELVKGNKEYENYAYVDAVKIFEKVFERGYKSADLLKRLGNAYYFQGDYVKASKWYGELFLLPTEKEGESYYRYAQSLKGIENYDTANLILEEFYKKYNLDSRALLAKEQQNYLDLIKKNSGRYIIGAINVNSDKSDFGSAFLGKSIVFASSRERSKVDAWSGQYCTDLFAFELKDDGSYEKPVKFGGDINTEYNESSPVFTKDGNTMYFTRNNYVDGKKGTNSKNVMMLKLYKATKINDKWKNIQELPFNSDNYNTAHPALSTDEKTLYFISDMPGSIGGSDIYKVEINGDSYGTPVNLGAGINTEGRESFPFVSAKNELYFSSDGYPGLGGLDVFVAKSAEGGNFETPLNVGMPINGSSDDFAFAIDTNTNSGFFSSNRENGTGSDDIYRLKELKEIINECSQNIFGLVVDASSGKPVDAVVVLYDNKGIFLREKKTDAKGYYDFGIVDCGTSYKVKVEKEGYTSVEKEVNTPNRSGKSQIDLAIDEQRIPLGGNLAQSLEIKNIYFDLDKAVIRPDAEVELAKIAEAMRQNPKLKIDVRSHTDCRNSASYNMALSERRVKATIAWIVKQGISKSRLTGKGYGESQLLNHCECEGNATSVCTEEQHQMNRRSEFIVSEF